jgi:hypothetical protein
MKTTVTILVHILCLLFVSACATGVQPVELTEDVENQIFRSRDTETAAIYSTLLNNDPRKYLSDSSVLMVVSETYLGADTNDDVYFKRTDSVLVEETLVDFRSLNEKTETINFLLSVNKPYEYISPAELILRLDDGQDWIRTHTVTSFSKVGFNNKLDQALVYMGHFCGEDCASGSVYFLVRENDVWKIRSEIVP